MTERDAPVTEDELHAYVDGALPADRIAAVEAELAADPQARARAAAWRTQADLIRDRFASVADEPLPERLRLETVTRRASGLKRKLAIAAVIAFLIGGAAGWIAHEYSGFCQNAQLDRALADAAIEAHRLYVNEVRHPIEVRAGEEHLLPWLSRRVGSPVKAPDLAPEGLKLLGGRLLPSPRGPTALIMYRGAGGARGRRARLGRRRHGLRGGRARRTRAPRSGGAARLRRLRATGRAALALCLPPPAHH